jgi:uncharacterized cupredoxin-like copper-binding protein
MRKRWTPFVAAGLAAALALAGAAVAAVVGKRSGASTTIKVTEREYHISLSSTSAKAGSVTFVVHNAGKITHKLDVAGGGLKKTAAMPGIAPGATRKLTVTLSGGKVSLWCPVPGHAALGMKTSLTIAGTTTAEVGQTTEPASTSGSAWG